FFQAEDRIRDRNVTGVQTCALPIFYFITIDELEAPLFSYNDQAYEVNLFRDHYVHAGMLSNVKTTNRLINVLGSVYASENDYDKIGRASCRKECRYSGSSKD